MDSEFLNNIHWMNSLGMFEVKFTSDNLPQLFTGALTMMANITHNMNCNISTMVSRERDADRLGYLLDVIKALCKWDIVPMSKYALNSVERIEPKEFEYEGYRDKFYNFEVFRRYAIGAYGMPAYKAATMDVLGGKRNLERAKEIIAQLDTLPPIYVIRNKEEPRLYVSSVSDQVFWGSLDYALYRSVVKPDVVDGGEVVCVHVGGNYKFSN